LCSYYPQSGFFVACNVYSAAAVLFTLLTVCYDSQNFTQQFAIIFIIGVYVTIVSPMYRSGAKLCSGTGLSWIIYLFFLIGRPFEVAAFMQTVNESSHMKDLFCYI